MFVLVPKQNLKFNNKINVDKELFLFQKERIVFREIFYAMCTMTYQGFNRKRLYLLFYFIQFFL